MADGRVKKVSSSSALSSSQEVYSIVMSQEEPFVFIGAISDWKCAHWNPEFLARELGDLDTRFKFARRDFNGRGYQMMETDCEFENGTLSNFCCWLRGEQGRAREFARFDRADYWCYAGYKYMAELFKDLPHLRHAVDWSKFGFPGRTGDDSTIWIGSQGASTPCHFDSYGCNLVAQIYGRKKWMLFPPNDTDKLYPTRVPYEESSVFSCVDVVNPDVNLFPSFKDAVQHQVILQPGDVLFVPKHWWHYVESLETSISINTWIELESDDVDRVHEAVTRTLVTALKRVDGSEESTWVNPSEEMGTHEENMGYLQQSLERLHQKVDTDSTGQYSEDKRPFDGVISTNDFINCMSSPQIIKLITEQLLRKFGSNVETFKSSYKDERRFTPGMVSTEIQSEHSCTTQVDSVVECCCARHKQVCEYKSIERDGRIALKRNDSEPSEDPDDHSGQKRQRLGFQDEAT